jgi:nicotinate-nucleotide adenylyltransferase
VSEHERIGVFGGTFDPVHRAHLAIARAAQSHANLDRVLFMLSAQPPHKQGECHIGAEERLALVETAIQHDTHMESSRLEMDRSGLSYTDDTLRQLEELHPHASFFLIIGQDSFVDFPHWFNPDAILERARLLVMARPGITHKVPSELTGHYDFVPFEEQDCSSTEIRRRIADGEEVTAYLTPEVEQYIRDKGFYHAHREV